MQTHLWPPLSSFLGATATQFLEWITPSSLTSLPPYSSTLSVILNEKGGIIDDTVITKHAEDAFYVVTNAGRRDRDLPWLREKLDEWNSSPRAEKGKVEMEVLEDWGLVALQGPEAATLLQGLTAFDLRQLTFGKCAFVPLEGYNVHVARGGYTGEDGFEVRLHLIYQKHFITFIIDLYSTCSNSGSHETSCAWARTADRPRSARQPAFRSWNVFVRP